MKKLAQFGLFLIVVALIAMGGCLLMRFIMPGLRQSNSAEAHVRIHEQLQITPEQEKILDPIEHRYAERRVQLTQTIQQSNMELANVILEDKTVSPRMDAVIKKIHAAQGELQMVTMRHVFEMKAVLTPEQANMLLKLTAKALKQESGSR